MDQRDIITIVSLLTVIFSKWGVIIGPVKRFLKTNILEGEWTSLHLKKDETGNNSIMRGKWIFHRTFFNVAKVKLTYKEELDGNVFYSSSINIFTNTRLAVIRVLQVKLASITLFGIFEDTVNCIWFGPESNEDNTLKAHYFILTTRELNDREAEEKINESRRLYLGNDFIC